MDEEVSSRWFGHYSCGDPVHRGYEPILMLNASTEDWVRVFDRDRSRLIFSIHAADEGHIGECQAVFDGRGGVEISLLIGRKELWHRGYGAAAALQLLDRIFYDYPVDQAWVSVPQDNVAALRLFSRLGFTAVSDRILCSATDGGALRAVIMALAESDYRHRKLPPESAGECVFPIVTVTGAPGSGSEHVAAESARLMRANFADEQITKELAIRLQRTEGELEALEASYASIWARMLRAALEPWERYGAMDASADLVGTFTRVDYIEPFDYLTKEQYIEGLKDVVAASVKDVITVIHGHGAVGLIPDGQTAFHVFIDMSQESRVQKARLETKLGADAARRTLRSADKRFESIHKGLYGLDALDASRYDISINMDRLTVESAARLISGAVARSTRAQPVTRRELQPA